MTEVTSKSELKAALERGETEFHTTNRNLLYGSALVAKFKKKASSLSSFERMLQDLKTKNKNLSVEIGAIIVITPMVLVTAVALYAIFKDYDVEADIPNGTFKAKKHR